MQKRLPAPNISLEGNIYPITSMIYLEDHQARLSLLVDHATGASSQKQVRKTDVYIRTMKNKIRDVTMHLNLFVQYL